MVLFVHLAYGDRHDDSDIVADVLQGQERIVSYPGTSQFNGRGISACGLAAMNFARVIFELIDIHNTREKLNDLLKAVTSKETIQDVISICSGWSSDLHLDVEDIQRVPLFVKSLKLVATRYGPPTAKHFKRTLQNMQTLSYSATVIITRPPEIIACTMIKTSGPEVFIIFDSHPRPSYPSGAGLILSTSIDQTATRLANILPAADNHLLNQGGFQWQAQLLNNVSGHIFISTGQPGGPSIRDMRNSVMDSSLALLRLQAEMADLKLKNVRLTSENDILEADVQRMEDALTTERKKVSSLETSSKMIAQSKTITRPNPIPATAQPTNAIAGPSRLSPPFPTSDENRRIPSPRTFSYSLSSDRHETDQELELEFNSLSPATTALAFELQRSFDVEDMQLRHQLQSLVDTAPLNFSCAICMEDHPVDNGVELDCDHSICRACIRGHVCSKIEEHRFPVLCPVCMTELNNRRPAEISGLVVQQIGIDERQYAIWEEMEMGQLSVVLTCRQCHRSIPVDKQEHDESRLLVCPLPDCNHVWCKACQQSIAIDGPTHSCDGSSELDHLMKKCGWKYCPNCKTPVQREGGCSHMTCVSPGCNTHFCYVCGKLIVRSALRNDIQTATSAHYLACRLFDYLGQ